MLVSIYTQHVRPLPVPARWRVLLTGQAFGLAVGGSATLLLVLLHQVPWTQAAWAGVTVAIVFGVVGTIWALARLWRKGQQ